MNFRRWMLVIATLVVAFLGCSQPGQVTLEVRIAEDEPAPGLTEMVFESTGERFYLHDEILVNQSDVDSASVITNYGRSSVALVLTDEGTRKLEELTQRNVGKRCGVVLNGQLVSAPVIMAPVRSGRAIITSDFTEAQAHRVAEALSGRKD